MSNYEFELTQPVNIVNTDITGVVIGRAEYIHRENHYLVEYSNKESDWWGESKLIPS